MVLRQAAQLLEVGGKIGVDLARYLAGTTVVQEVLVQHLGQLGHLLVPLPARDLAEELRVDILEALGLAVQLPLEPLNGGGFVDDEYFELDYLLRGQALLVVLDHLIGEEDHAVAFGEMAGQAGQEFSDRQGHRHVAKDVEGDHAIEQQMRLAFVDDLHPPLLGHEHGELPEMGAEKSQTPSSVPLVRVKRSSRPSLGL